MFQLTGDRTEGNRRGGFLETRAWSRVFLRISNNNMPALVATAISKSTKCVNVLQIVGCYFLAEFDLTSFNSSQFYIFVVFYS